MPPEMDQLIEQLTLKLGDDADASTLLVALSAAWAQQSARLKLVEERAQVAGGIAATSVQAVSASMGGYAAGVRADDAQLAQLHEQVRDALSGASEHATLADNAMRDVLSIYSQFQGNVSQLKTGVGSLAKSVLASAVPGAGPLLDGKIDKLLGLEGAGGN